MAPGICLTCKSQVPEVDLVQAFKRDVEAAATSNHQCDVARVLDSLGVDHMLNELVADGLFCADVLIASHHIVLQVDGYHHWTSNTGQCIGKLRAMMLADVTCT